MLVIAGSAETLSEDETDDFPGEASQFHTDINVSKLTNRLEDPSTRISPAG